MATSRGLTFVDLNDTGADADTFTAVADVRVPLRHYSVRYDALDRPTSATGAYGSWTSGYSSTSTAYRAIRPFPRRPAIA